MFDFTGWTFEEGEQRGGDAEDEEQGGLSPSIARPPPGMEYDLDDNENTRQTNVRCFLKKKHLVATNMYLVTYRTWCFEVLRIRVTASKSKCYCSKLRVTRK